MFDAYIEKLIHTKSKSSFLDDTSQEITLTNTITCRNEHVIEWLQVRHKQRQHQAIQQQQEEEEEEQQQQQQEQKGYFSTVVGGTTLMPMNSANAKGEYNYHGLFPIEMDQEMMSYLSTLAQEERRRMETNSTHSMNLSIDNVLMNRHRRASASAAVMESVYLQFYTKRKMFSTRHLFSMKTAKDCLKQTEIIRLGLESILKIDETFVNGLATCRAKHEHTFKWSTMDPSPLMRSTYWIAADRLMVGQAKESEHRVYGSAVVSISLTLLSFKLVSLSYSRSSLSKTPKQVFFNPYKYI